MQDFIISMKKNIASLIDPFEKNNLCIIKFDNFKKVDSKQDVEQCDDVNAISEFYFKVGKPDLSNTMKISKMIQNGGMFFCIKEGNSIVSGLWILCGKVILNNPSSIIMSKKLGNPIIFHKSVGYIAYVNTLLDFRGRGYCCSILKYAFSYLVTHSNFEKFVLTTGCNNNSMLNVVYKLDGKIINVSTLYRVFSVYVCKNKISIDKEICWQTSSGNGGARDI